MLYLVPGLQISSVLDSRGSCKFFEINTFSIFPFIYIDLIADGISLRWE